MFRVICLNEYSTTFSLHQNSRLLQSNFRDVTVKTLSRMTVALAAVLNPGYALSPHMVNTVLLSTSLHIFLTGRNLRVFLFNQSTRRIYLHIVEPL